MLNGDVNQRTAKKLIGLISKKTSLHVQHTFFVHFFAVVLHDYNPPWWPLAFIIFSPPLKNFHGFLPTKIRLLCFYISRSSPFSVIHVRVDIKN